ncbi:hypothetical protein COO60DRAFT_1640964 [Scenedesmus sp. NREL 46B-D3]|nr:hypothetical protein COO60DRAFT_1640964 [Scenedesmus sp. NREL 46B-D3]
MQRAADDAEAWGVGWQLDERSLLWNDDVKIRLVTRVAAQEPGMSEAELQDRLATLRNLLPDLAPRLAKAPPKRLAQLAAATHTLAARLLRLRFIFPKASHRYLTSLQANISALVERRLSLLLEDDLGEVEAAAARLCDLLPGILVDTFVEAHPQVLEVRDFEAAIEDAKRMMPHIDVATALRNSPELVLSFQKGKHLIPYDEPWPISRRAAAEH